LFDLRVACCNAVAVQIELAGIRCICTEQGVDVFVVLGIKLAMYWRDVWFHKNRLLVFLIVVFNQVCSFSSLVEIETILRVGQAAATPAPRGI
jgi:hypothetical protein